MDIGDIFSDSLGYPSKNLKRVVCAWLIIAIFDPDHTVIHSAWVRIESD